MTPTTKPSWYVAAQPAWPLPQEEFALLPVAALVRACRTKASEAAAVIEAVRVVVQVRQKLLQASSQAGDSSAEHTGLTVDVAVSLGKLMDADKVCKPLVLP